MKIRRFNEDNNMVSDNTSEIRDILNMYNFDTSRVYTYYRGYEQNYPYPLYFTDSLIQYNVYIPNDKISDVDEFIEYHKSLSEIMNRLNSSYNIIKTGRATINNKDHISIKIDTGVIQPAKYPKEALNDILNRLRKSERIYPNNNDLFIRDNVEVRKALGLPLVKNNDNRRANIPIKYKGKTISNIKLYAGGATDGLDNLSLKLINKDDYEEPILKELF